MVDILFEQKIKFSTSCETKKKKKKKKKKGRGTRKTDNEYVVIQAGVNNENRAAGGVIFYVNKAYKDAKNKKQHIGKKSRFSVPQNEMRTSINNCCVRSSRRGERGGEL